MPADVSHRNYDGEAGEFCSYEGRLRQLPAAPASPPLQLPLPTPNALGSYPQEGQGEIHVQVKHRGPLGGWWEGATHTCGCEPASGKALSCARGEAG